MIASALSIRMRDLNSSYFSTARSRLRSTTVCIPKISLSCEGSRPWRSARARMSSA
jgi:hypothetical protein